MQEVFNYCPLPDFEQELVAGKHSLGEFVSELGLQGVEFFV
ncbi:MAG: hypothetical protein RSC56_01490 [Acidaminococcaceae bacterium]